MILVFCSIFYNIPQTKALTVTSISSTSGPSVGGQNVQITTSGLAQYKPVDGLIFSNPQGSGVTPNQYIDTGVTQNMDPTIELKFKLADGSICNSTGDGNGTPGMRIFGSWKGWDTNSIYLARLSGTNLDRTDNRCAFSIRRGQTVGETGASQILPMGNNTFDTDVHTWLLKGTTDTPTGKWDTIDLNAPNAALPNANPVSMYLGTTHHADSGVSGVGLDGTVYSLKIWYDGELIRDFVPVCDIDHVVCGMYEKVLQEFVGNIGSGTLTGGAFLPDDVQVSFDGVAATNTSVSGNVVQATTPAHRNGEVDVAVSVNGQKATLTNGYTYRPTITDVNLDYGPTTGGTGFGAAWQPNGTITITGNEFIGPNKIRNYINKNKITGWTNPAFTGFTSSDAYGGTISSPNGLYPTGSHEAWHAFDKQSYSGSNNWVPSTSNPITATYTLPASKYVNLSSIDLVNGDTDPIKYARFYAGANISAPPITNGYTITDSTAHKTYNIYPTSDNADLWTNQITIEVGQDTFGSFNYAVIDEIYYKGSVINLNGQGMSSFPTSFHLDTYFVEPKASAVSIGGTPCVSFTVVSGSEITCQPAAHVKGLYDVSITVDGYSSTTPTGLADSDDYEYIEPIEITSIVSDVGSEDGGEDITITGKGFLAPNKPGMHAPTITFDPSGTPADCDLKSATDTQIVCTTSAHSPELVDVKVDNGLQNATASDGFLYYETYLGLASSLNGGVVSFSVLPSDPSDDSNFDIITVRTNLPTGYRLKMKTANNTLTCIGLSVCSSQWFNSISATGSLSDDSWGHQLNYLADPTEASQTNPTKPSTTAWQPIPVADTTIYNKSSINLGTTDVGGDKFRLWYGAKASWLLPASTYERTVTITAVANI